MKQNSKKIERWTNLPGPKERYPDAPKAIYKKVTATIVEMK